MKEINSKRGIVISLLIAIFFVAGVIIICTLINLDSSYNINPIIIALISLLVSLPSIHLIINHFSISVNLYNDELVVKKITGDKKINLENVIYVKKAESIYAYTSFVSEEYVYVITYKNKNKIKKLYVLKRDNDISKQIEEKFKIKEEINDKVFYEESDNFSTPDKLLPSYNCKKGKFNFITSLLFILFFVGCIFVFIYAFKNDVISMLLFVFFGLISIVIAIIVYIKSSPNITLSSDGVEVIRMFSNKKIMINFNEIKKITFKNYVTPYYELIFVKDSKIKTVNIHVNNDDYILEEYFPKIN